MSEHLVTLPNEYEETKELVDDIAAAVNLWIENQIDGTAVIGLSDLSARFKSPWEDGEFLRIDRAMDCITSLKIEAPTGGYKVLFSRVQYDMDAETIAITAAQIFLQEYNITVNKHGYVEVTDK